MSDNTTPQQIFTLLPKLLAAVGGVARARSPGVSYTSRSVHAVCAAVRDACIQVGISPEVTYTEASWDSGAAVTALVRLYAPDGSYVAGTASARVPYPKHGPTPQTHGAACSYALKAALQGMLLIADEDPDAVPEAARDMLAGAVLEAKREAGMTAGAVQAPAQRDWVAEAGEAKAAGRDRDWIESNRGALMVLDFATADKVRAVLRGKP